MTILLSLIQSEKQVRLERPARVFPSRRYRRKTFGEAQTFGLRERRAVGDGSGIRFLDLPNLTILIIWFLLITYWLTTYCRIGQTLSIAIDPVSMGVH